MPAAVLMVCPGAFQSSAGARGEPSLNGDRSRESADVGDADLARLAVCNRSLIRLRCGERSSEFGFEAEIGVEVYIA
jgi:hypothetical protein